ncbi:MAG TPA: hypothetical protein RMG48_08310 [Myxococcales bacterium LLY-WYZ-16_1]|nr:hypothetical protein [Myxococcales bacterium LLY-WYZ-16_1]
MGLYEGPNLDGAVASVPVIEFTRFRLLAESALGARVKELMVTDSQLQTVEIVRFEVTGPQPIPSGGTIEFAYELSGFVELDTFTLTDGSGNVPSDPDGGPVSLSLTDASGTIEVVAGPPGTREYVMFVDSAGYGVAQTLQVQIE